MKNILMNQPFFLLNFDEVENNIHILEYSQQKLLKFSSPLQTFP